MTRYANTARAIAVVPKMKYEALHADGEVREEEEDDENESLPPLPEKIDDENKLSLLPEDLLLLLNDECWCRWR